MPGLLRGLVDTPGLLLPLDLPADHTLANCHEHVIHGGVLRQGEGVDGLNALVKGIVELLIDLDPGDEPGDLGLHIRVFQGAEAQGLALFVHG